MRPILLAACVGCIALISQSLGGAITSDPRNAPAGAYQLDTRHTQVLFAIRHLGLTDYYGRFDKISGSLNFNPPAPEKSSVNVVIDMTSVDVMSSELIGELTGASAFDAAQYPQATFVSTALTRTGPTTGTMTGNLTLHGVTRPVTFNVTFNGGGTEPTSGRFAIGFHADTVIHRADFGLTKMVWSSFVADDVKLTIEAMFDQQKV